MKDLEQIILEALKLKDQGKTDADILNMFSEHKDELTEILNTERMLSDAKNDIMPSTELLERIVTKTNHFRYISQKGSNGRSPREIINGIYETMTSKLKILTVGIGAVVIALLVYGQQSKNNPVSDNQPTQVENVDDMVNLLIEQSASEQLILGESDSDIYASDAQSINEYEGISQE